MKKGLLLSLAGLLFIAAALALVGYNMLQNRMAGERSDAVLEELTPIIPGDPVPVDGREHRIGEDTEAQLVEIEYPDYVLNPDMNMPVQNIRGYDYVGVLRLPTLDKELPIINEWSYPDLKVSPCRFSGTAYLGNMVICAHNFRRHFGEIKDLAYGDPVTFTDMDGNVFSYKVAEIETLRPTAVEEMTSGEWDLTLFTCTKGGATRVTVRCERADPAGTIG